MNGNGGLFGWLVGRLGRLAKVDRFGEERGSIPEWVMLLVMGVGVVMALWAIVQPSLGNLVSSALGKLSGGGG